MYMSLYDNNNIKIDKFNNIYINLIRTKFNIIKNNIDKIKSNIEIMKHNEYNALLIKNNILIKDINDIDNGIYDIKINGKIKKISIKLI